MKKSGVFSNSQVLRSRIIELGLTATEAALSTGINPKTFYPLTRHDQEISIKTASKLRAAFGVDAIKIHECRADF